MIRRAVQQGADYLLSVDPATAAYPSPWAPKPSGNWWKFGFPVFYVTDLLQIVEALAEISRQLAAGRAELKSLYGAVVTEKGNVAAQRIIEQETSRFMSELYHRATGPLIQQLREGWQKPKEEELKRLLIRLPGGPPGLIVNLKAFPDGFMGASDLSDLAFIVPSDVSSLVARALDAGLTVIVVSTDFEEVAHICHRALVFSRGVIVAEIAEQSLTTQSLIHAASASEAA